ncbi:AEC family transporter [Fictibacillus phosphorivorans]|uniref:AEC family transporter n=1 Tax=Fictibacillus phosphorivorans TaxID=1221500 RepID=UPI00203BAFC7|nr:AEC family transporter [Fictibacillus phosphorivorans]MCM3720083.1 AEC family transporter [Fictibacillus phosphorivorans]MCM3777773.1 AEC family transporter [Fictibacillus phosphorivorans]
MNQFAQFTQELTLLYSIALIGYMLRKKDILPDGTERILTAVILNVTLPALILFGMDVSFSVENVIQFGWLSFMSAFVLIVSSTISSFTVKKVKPDAQKKNALEGIMIFGNQGFLGIAVCFLLFGKEGVFYGTLFNFIYLLYIWTYAIYLFARSAESFQWKKVFLNSGVIATLTGLLLMILPGTLPQVVSNTLELTGKPTVPLSMLLIGSLLGSMSLTDLKLFIKDKTLWLASFYKLILFPLLLLPFLRFSLPFELFAVAFLVAGMPSAPTISMYAQSYGEDASFAAAGVALSTILSYISIPALYSFLLIISSFT